MIIGVPKEIKNNENRVSLTPAGVLALTRAGHTVLAERSAGVGSGISDEEYAQSGAQMTDTAASVYARAELIVKVKEPLEEEYALMREGQTLFTYLHLAPNRPLTQALLNRRITGIAFETVQLPDGSLPLLAPMSEVAGRMSIQVGAQLLLSYHGGRGVLLGGVPGVLPANVLIIGGGVVGMNAARMAMGLGAQVTIMDINTQRLAALDSMFQGRVVTLAYSEYNAAQAIRQADLLVGAVLVAGARAPKIVTEAMVRTMKPGSVIVDVAIDQGGCVETVDRITTHDNPCYVRCGVVHYSVANMPGAVPRTSTFALESATLPYLLKMANLGVKPALLASKPLMAGLNTCAGHVTRESVAQAMGLPYTPPEDLLSV